MSIDFKKAAKNADEGKNVNLDVPMNDEATKAEIMEGMNAIALRAESVESIGLTVSDFENPSGKSLYCSLKMDGTPESKADLFNAINAPDEKISDHMGDVISLKDVVAHPVSLINEETGELMQCMRIILIDDKGVSYGGVSGGIATAIQTIFEIYGQPSEWVQPIKVKIMQKGTRNGNNKVNTLRIEK